MRNLVVSTGSILSLLMANVAFTAEDYTPPMTEFGVPDVQGIWNFKTRTGLERPDVYDGA